MAAHHRAAQRVSAGSAVLTRRAGAWLLPDTWTAMALRFTGASIATTYTWTTIQAAPGLMWPLTGGWCIAAWRAGRDTPKDNDQEEPEETDTVTEEPSPPQPQAIITNALREMIGDRGGIQLPELYGRLRQRPALAHLPDLEFRRMLKNYDIPVSRSVRSGETVLSGVRLADLPSPEDNHPTQPFSTDVEGL
jgi:hypothetical protein